MTRTTLLILFTMTSMIFLTSCGTTTRIGAFIPAHKKSNQRKGQHVRIDILNLETNKKSLESVASWAAGEAIDYVVKELKKEAKLYEATFSKKKLIKNIEGGETELGKEAYIVLRRWVDGTNEGDTYQMPNPKEYTKFITNNKIFKETLKSLEGQLATENKNFTAKSILEFNKISEDPEKELAFFLILKMEVIEKHVASLKKISLFDRKPRAKVVAFRRQPWLWISDLLLKTDDKVKVEANVEIKALTNSKDGSSKLITILNEQIKLPDVNLKGKSKVIDLKEQQIGSWFTIPSLAELIPQLDEPPERAPIGQFLTLEIKVTEKDPSNTGDVITKSAEKLDEEKGGLIEKITQ